MGTKDNSVNSGEFARIYGDLLSVNFSDNDHNKNRK